MTNLFFYFFIKGVNASLRFRSVVYWHLRGATGICFFQRIYLFTEDLLGLISVSVFQPTHTLTSPSHSALTLRRNYVGFISICMRIIKKSQKNKSRQLLINSWLISGISMGKNFLMNISYKTRTLKIIRTQIEAAGWLISENKNRIFILMIVVIVKYF